MRFGLKVWVCFLIGCFLACTKQPVPPQQTTPKKLTLDPRSALLQKFADGQKLTVVYYEGDRDLMAQACGVLEDFFHGSKDIEWVSDMALHPTDLTGKSVLMVGDHRHHLLKMLLEKMPLDMSETAFKFHDKTFDQDSDVLTMVYPNPVDPTMPLFLLTGNQAKNLYPYISTPFARQSVTVFRKNKIILEGQFVHEPDIPWQLRETGWRTLMDQTKLATTNDRYRIYNYRMAADQTAINHAMMNWDHQWATLEAFLDRKMTMPEPVDVYLYRRFEDKLKIFAGYDQPTINGNPSIQHFSKDHRAIHQSLEPGIDLVGPGPLITLLASQNLGNAKSPLLEKGLATLLTPQWGGQGAPYWSARLTRAGWTPSLKELFSHPEYLDYLPLSHLPLAASLVAFLEQQWGPKRFAKRYATWIPSERWLENQESAWQAYLREQMALALKSPHIAAPRIPRLPDFARGANHTFEGFSVDRGYLGTLSDASLTHLAEIGANSVALIPYVRAKSDVPVPLFPLLGSNKENDASIIHAGLHAKSLGMAVLLKPQLEGPWPGHIRMTSEKDWRRFLNHYRRMIRHYAVMAEMHGFSAISVGTELVEASKHEIFWRELASDLRMLYSGKLVYSANWGEEFERISFWDAYDAMGLNCYYPLSVKENPSDEDLKAGAASIIARIDQFGEKFRKPVWLTEVGFASVEMPWVNPYQDHHKHVYDGKAQARCYRAFIDAMAHSRAIQGVWWWKWHSDGRAGSGDKSFSCQDKPAQQVLGSWLSARE